METNKFEQIEKYLSGNLNPKEEEEFAKELKNSNELAEQTKTIAYIIHSINDIGLKKDNERIEKVYNSISNDKKKYAISIAAMFAVVLTFAAVVSVPVYQNIIKPVIEKVLSPKPVSVKEPNVMIIDSLLNYQDSIVGDSTNYDVKEVIEKKETREIKKIVKEVKPENKVDETLPEPALPIVKDTIIVEKKVQTQDKEIKEVSKPVNRIVSYSNLKNYHFGEVIARREGKNIICSFIMKNEVEDAEIQMHSARAKDINGENYLAKNCLLNGKNKRIIEKWKKDEEHMIEIKIVNVSSEVSEFESISFSFQSQGDSLKQNSLSIILKVGKII